MSAELVAAGLEVRMCPRCGTRIEKNQGCDDEGQGSVDGVSDLFVEVGPAATAVERLLVGEGGGSLRESALLAADYTDCGALRLAAVICGFARRQSWGL